MNAFMDIANVTKFSGGQQVPSKRHYSTAYQQNQKMTFPNTTTKNVWEPCRFTKTKVIVSTWSDEI